MKILAIRGRNLASLQRSFALDLEQGPLAGVGLFAITGPVGAGKSTLLDALCLALFDRTPRLSGRGGVVVGESDGSGDEALRSNDPRTLLRRDAVEGHAEVDFRGQDGVRYRAHWTVRRARKKADGRVQDQELWLRDLDRDVVVASGRKTEVLAAIEARLGLDFAQFCRSVLLAQGEFAAFLKASADERAKLLERLTGADLYRRLSRAAHERRRSWQERLATLQAQADAQQLLGDGERAALADAVAALAKELALHELAVQLASGYVDWFAQAARCQQAQSEAVVALRRATGAVEAGKGERERLRRLQQALPLVPHAERIAAAQRRLVAATAAEQDAERAVAAAAQQAAVAASALRQALAAGPGEGALPLVEEFPRWRGPLQRWLTAEARLRQLVLAGPTLATVATQSAAAVAAAAHERQAAEAAAAAERAALDALVGGEVGEALVEERRQWRVAFERWRLADDVRVAWQRAAADHAAALAAVEAAAAAAERLQAAGPGLAAAATAAAAAREVAERALAAEQHRQQAAALREHLRDGEPCPLCGSAEHPQPVAGDPAALQAAAARLAAAERAARAADAALREQRAENERAQTRLQAAQHTLRAGEPALASQCQAAARFQAAEAVAPFATWVHAERRRLDAGDAALQQRERQRDERQRRWQVASQRERAAMATLAAVVERQQAAERAAAAAARGLQQHGEDLARLTAEVDERRHELAPAFTDAAAFGALQDLGEALLARCQTAAACADRRRAAAAEVAAATARRAAAARDRQAVEADLREANDAFAAAVAAAGLAPVEVAEARALGGASIAARLTELQALDDAVVAARAVVQERTEVCRQHEATGRPEIAEADAAAALDDAVDAQRRIAARHKEQAARLEVDDLLRRARAQLAPQVAAAEAQLATWAALDELIGSSTGDAFAVFAQDLTLDLLLVEANRRLQELARRYRLQKNRGGELDFVVVDLDLGGVRRSLQTLSGGETFLVSLALALALATLAAPRSRVETLFLDEGFGTLDAQNLEQALGALDSLQAAGCQVGVISHVDGIAERIGAVVELVPEGAGSSRVRVRG